MPLLGTNAFEQHEQLCILYSFLCKRHFFVGDCKVYRKLLTAQSWFGQHYKKQSRILVYKITPCSMTIKMFERKLSLTSIFITNSLFNFAIYVSKVVLFFEIALLDKLLNVGNLDGCTLGTIETESIERIRCHFLWQNLCHRIQSFGTRKLLIRV